MISIESSSSTLLSYQLKLPFPSPPKIYILHPRKSQIVHSSNFFPLNYPPSTFFSLRTIPDIPHPTLLYFSKLLTPSLSSCNCVTVKSSLHPPCPFFLVALLLRIIPSPTLDSRELFPRNGANRLAQLNAKNRCQKIPVAWSRRFSRRVPIRGKRESGGDRITAGGYTEGCFGTNDTSG